jgi:membrane protein DedA with SNARE-associated domain
MNGNERKIMGEIEHLIGALEPLIREYGAAAVMVIILLEALGAPVPGETLLVFASALAGRGELSWPTLFAAAWGGAVLGDNLGFAIGRYAGRGLILRYGARIGLGPERLAKVESTFMKYGSMAVAFARFVAFLRQLNGPVAGALGMDWRRFLLFEAFGAAMWVAVWMLFGVYIGEHATALLGIARRFWPAAVAVAGLALVGALVFRARARQRLR